VRDGIHQLEENEVEDKRWRKCVWEKQQRGLTPNWLTQMGEREPKKGIYCYCCSDRLRKGLFSSKGIPESILQEFRRERENNLQNSLARTMEYVTKAEVKQMQRCFNQFAISKALFTFCFIFGSKAML